jgi:hypothetical protein
MRRQMWVALAISAAAAAAASSSSVSASSKWTEFGATRKGWYSAHVPDPNPKLIKGCCFLPRQRDGTDRYFGVQYQDFGRGVSRVWVFEMWFAPAISFAAAKHVARSEAPPAARLVFTKRYSDCFRMTFRSSALSRAFKSKHAVMDVTLYSSATGGPFNGRSVMNMIFSPTSSFSGC